MEVNESVMRASIGFVLTCLGITMCGTGLWLLLLCL